MPTLRDSSAISTACMEHQILHHIMQALRVTLDWQAPAVSMPRKLSSLQFTIKSFQRHFDRVISLEEDGGYMAEVLDARPYFQDRIDQLASDHVRFRERLHDFRRKSKTCLRTLFSRSAKPKPSAHTISPPTPTAADSPGRFCYDHQPEPDLQGVPTLRHVPSAVSKAPGSLICIAVDFAV